MVPNNFQLILTASNDISIFLLLPLPLVARCFFRTHFPSKTFHFADPFYIRASLSLPFSIVNLKFTFNFPLSYKIRKNIKYRQMSFRQYRLCMSLRTYRPITSHSHRIAYKIAKTVPAATKKKKYYLCKIFVFVASRHIALHPF